VIEFVGQFGLGLRVVLALLMNVPAPGFRGTRLAASGESQ
jgi:hypothetical protein